MFELTRRADYALRLMIDVGARSGTSVSTAEVARREDIPYQFLRKVARDLVTSGLLNAGRGIRGGVSLSRQAEAITVLDVVRAIDPPAINHCTVDPFDCERRGYCAAFPVWLKVQDEIERVLGGVRLSDLVRRHKARMRAAGQPRPERRHPAPRSSTKSPEELVQMARLRRVIRGLDSSGITA